MAILDRQGAPIPGRSCTKPRDMVLLVTRDGGATWNPIGS